MSSFHLSPAAQSTASSIAIRPLLRFLWPEETIDVRALFESRRRKELRDYRTFVRHQEARKQTAERMENVFITSLARAGCCQQSRMWAARKDTKRCFSTRATSDPSVKLSKSKHFTREYQTSNRTRSAAATAQREATCERLIELVDLYPMHEKLDDDEDDLFAEDRTPRSKSRLRLPNRDNDMKDEGYGSEESWQSDESPQSDWPEIMLPKQDWSDGKAYTADEAFTGQEHEAAAHLERLLKADHSDLNTLFEAYQALPFPRASYLPSKTVHRLLSRMAVTKHRDERHVLRYLSILDDMKVADIAAHRDEWSTAVHMAAQTNRTVTGAKVESALYIWRDMERQPGIRSSEVTFNILFEIASKAAKSPLVELILQEMETRNVPKTRFFRFISIFYYGVIGDGDAVRRAYREFVAAGEIVDTSVLNAVIVSLYRCGENAAAEAVFERMKHMHGSVPGRDEPPRDWLKQRQYWRFLERQAHRIRDDDEARRELQNSAPLAPDSRTYRILIQHAAQYLGDWEKTEKWLKEMRENDLPMTRAHYVSLFHAFVKHSPGLRRRITDWIEPRLQALWDDFLEHFEADPEEFALNERAVKTMLLAWWMTAGREKMRWHWNKRVKTRWKNGTPEEVKRIKAWVRQRFPDEGWEDGVDVYSELVI